MNGFTMDRQGQRPDPIPAQANGLGYGKKGVPSARPRKRGCGRVGGVPSGLMGSGAGARATQGA